MKIIFKIAKTELQKLFYSPVAWLIIVIFTFQAALFFTSTFGSYIKSLTLGFEQADLTHRIYSGQFGLFSFFANYLYLYIPLLTMGVMSRESSSGSIKLLFSSPITNGQIILGKYLSLMIFGLVLMGILSVFVLFGAATIIHVGIPLLLCSLLGIYLLICAYAAIGLFVSSLTPHMVVAAMGTLGIFALLAYVKILWQDIEMVRDITYWLALSGRVDTFIRGMITSEDFLYFIIVISLFLALTIFKLQSGRQKVNWLVSWGRYIAVIFVAMILGYLSSMPKLKGYIDATYAKENTLAKGSQQVISKIPDNITITTYTNMLGSMYNYTMPDQYKNDVSSNFENYLRFNPTIKLKYVYFYHKADNKFFNELYPKLNDKQLFDTLKRLSDWDFKILPYSDIASKVDLSTEGFRTVRLIETPEGKRTFIRFFNDGGYFASEAEITAAFKHLVTELPTVGFLTGQSERSTKDESERGYYMFTRDKTFRYALINQGFDFEDVTLDKPIPRKIQILVIAEMKRLLTGSEKKYLEDYIVHGGNMIIMGEPGRQTFMNFITDPLGVRFLPGTLVHNPGKTIPTQVNLNLTKTGIKHFKFMDDIVKFQMKLMVPTTNALEVDSTKGFNVITWFTTQPDSCWSELETTNFTDDTAKFNPDKGEVKKVFTTMVSLNRKVGNKEQKILISGDADWMSAAELNMTRNEIRPANYTVIYGAFTWLSDGEAPIDISRPDAIDNYLRIGKTGWGIANPFFKWIFPSILTLIGIAIWIRRRGR